MNISKATESVKSEQKNISENIVTNSIDKANLVNVSAVFGFKTSCGKFVDLKIHIKCTNETFNVSKFPVNLKIQDLKNLLEFVCGIPYNLQKLSYLDDGELIDNKDLQYYDIIDGALIVLNIWTIYVGLVQASVLGDLDLALNQGVSERIEWKSPTYDYMFTIHRTKYISERSGISLFIASHRGNINLVKGLISHGANINYQSSYGRTPIMVSVVANKTAIIEYLLANNADIDLADVNGDSPIVIAKRFNNKLGTHKLTQFKWKKRTEAELKSKKSYNKLENDMIFPERRFPHQIFDSSKKTWLKGDFMQIYMMQLKPDIEYSGSCFSAPRSVGKEVLRKHFLSKSSTDLKNKSHASYQDKEIKNEEDEDGIGFISPFDNGLTFDKWLAQKQRAKKKLIEQKKKKETEQLANLEKFEENLKESTKSNINRSVREENTTWMKDYLNNKNRIDRQNYNNTQKLNNDNQIFLANSISNRLKNSDMFDIYKGMSYDEWTTIRDNFLRAHNMV